MDDNKFVQEETNADNRDSEINISVCKGVWDPDMLPYTVSFMSLTISPQELETIDSKVCKMCNNQPDKDKIKILQSIFLQEIPPRNIDNANTCFSPLYMDKNLNYVEDEIISPIIKPKPNNPPRKCHFGAVNFIAMRAETSGRRSSRRNDYDDNDYDDNAKFYREISINTKKIKYKQISKEKESNDDKSAGSYEPSVDDSDVKSPKTKKIKKLPDSEDDKQKKKTNKTYDLSPFQPSISSLPRESEDTSSLLMKNVIIKKKGKSKISSPDNDKVLRDIIIVTSKAKFKIDARELQNTILQKNQAENKNKSEENSADKISKEDISVSEDNEKISKQVSQSSFVSESNSGIYVTISRKSFHNDTKKKIVPEEDISSSKLTRKKREDQKSDSKEKKELKDTKKQKVIDDDESLSNENLPTFRLKITTSGRILRDKKKTNAYKTNEQLSDLCSCIENKIEEKSKDVPSKKEKKEDDNSSNDSGDFDNEETTIILKRKKKSRDDQKLQPKETDRKDMSDNRAIKKRKIEKLKKDENESTESSIRKEENVQRKQDQKITIMEEIYRKSSTNLSDDSDEIETLISLKLSKSQNLDEDNEEQIKTSKAKQESPDNRKIEFKEKGKETKGSAQQDKVDRKEKKVLTEKDNKDNAHPLIIKITSSRKNLRADYKKASDQSIEENTKAMKVNKTEKLKDNKNQVKEDSTQRKQEQKGALMQEIYRKSSTNLSDDSYELETLISLKMSKSQNIDDEEERTKPPKEKKDTRDNKKSKSKETISKDKKAKKSSQVKIDKKDKKVKSIKTDKDSSAEKGDSGQRKQEKITIMREIFRKSSANISDDSGEIETVSLKISKSHDDDEEQTKTGKEKKESRDDKKLKPIKGKKESGKDKKTKSKDVKEQIKRSKSDTKAKKEVAKKDKKKIVDLEDSDNSSDESGAMETSILLKISKLHSLNKDTDKTKDTNKTTKAKEQSVVAKSKKESREEKSSKSKESTLKNKESKKSTKQIKSKETIETEDNLNMFPVIIKIVSSRGNMKKDIGNLSEESIPENAKAIRKDKTNRIKENKNQSVDNSAAKEDSTLRKQDKKVSAKQDRKSSDNISNDSYEIETLISLKISKSQNLDEDEEKTETPKGKKETREDKKSKSKEKITSGGKKDSGEEKKSKNKEVKEQTKQTKSDLKIKKELAEKENKKTRKAEDDLQEDIGFSVKIISGKKLKNDMDLKSSEKTEPKDTKSIKEMKTEKSKETKNQSKDISRKSNDDRSKKEIKMPMNQEICGKYSINLSDASSEVETSVLLKISKSHLDKSSDKTKETNEVKPEKSGGKLVKLKEQPSATKRKKEIEDDKSSKSKSKEDKESLKQVKIGTKGKQELAGKENKETRKSDDNLNEELPVIIKIKNISKNIKPTKEEDTDKIKYNENQSKDISMKERDNVGVQKGAKRKTSQDIFQKNSDLSDENGDLEVKLSLKLSKSRSLDNYKKTKSADDDSEEVQECPLERRRQNAWALAYIELCDDGPKLVQVLHTSPCEPGRYLFKEPNEFFLFGPQAKQDPNKVAQKEVKEKKQNRGNLETVIELKIQESQNNNQKPKPDSKPQTPKKGIRSQRNEEVRDERKSPRNDKPQTPTRSTGKYQKRDSSEDKEKRQSLCRQHNCKNCLRNMTR